jgi:TrmH family RNA methyltransferase
MASRDLDITSPQNPRIKQLVRLRNRTGRDRSGLFIVEGYREIRRALDNGWRPAELYVCRDLFLGKNEESVIAQARQAGARVLECVRPAFEKVAYRDRPEGLLAVGPQLRLRLEDIRLPERPLLLVAESIEKPGNLGTLLRSADAAGVHGVVVCDRCTDIHNPNVVRASIGTLFSLPVAEATSDETRAWLRRHRVQIVAATPRGDRDYTEADLARPTALVVGTEQYGLSEDWMELADARVRIPMLGQADSLNVAAATTILLYEAVRQRRRAK